MATFKRLADLKQGDKVSTQGGIFKVMASAYNSTTHGPRGADGLVIGPSCVVVARAVCISGTVPGYFAPGTPWTLQGTIFKRVQVLP